MASTTRHESVQALQGAFPQGTPFEIRLSRNSFGTTYIMKSMLAARPCLEKIVFFTALSLEFA
jgi:hypothetical protein